METLFLHSLQELKVSTAWFNLIRYFLLRRTWKTFWKRREVPGNQKLQTSKTQLIQEIVKRLIRKATNIRLSFTTSWRRSGRFTKLTRELRFWMTNWEPTSESGLKLPIRCTKITWIRIRKSYSFLTAQRTSSMKMEINSQLTGFPTLSQPSSKSLFCQNWNQKQWRCSFRGSTRWSCWRDCTWSKTSKTFARRTTSTTRENRLSTRRWSSSSSFKSDQIPRLLPENPGRVTKKTTSSSYHENLISERIPHSWHAWCCSGTYLTTSSKQPIFAISSNASCTIITRRSLLSKGSSSFRFWFTCPTQGRVWYSPNWKTCW